MNNQNLVTQVNWYYITSTKTTLCDKNSVRFWHTQLWGKPLTWQFFCIQSLIHKKGETNKITVYLTVLYSSITEYKLKWKETCRYNSDNNSIERIVNQNLLKILEEIHNVWIGVGVRAWRAIIQRHVHRHALQLSHSSCLAILNNRRHHKSFLIQGEKGHDCCLVIQRSLFKMIALKRVVTGNQLNIPESGGKVGRYRIHAAWRRMWSLRSKKWLRVSCHLQVSSCSAFWSSSCHHQLGNFRAFHNFFFWWVL